MSELFFKKKGIAIEKIAAEIYLLSVNDRLPTMNELQEKYNLSRGTVQNALSFLKKEEAIKTKSRGHLGTFIEQIDYKKLQTYSSAQRIIGTMPLPYSKLYEGLATGLYTMFNNQNIKLNLAFIRGAKERIEASESGTYDFAVVSRFAAEEEMKNDSNISIALEFGANTYLSKHILIFSEEGKNEIEDGMKVGIDEDSLDHYHLTKDLVEGKDVTLVNYPANQLIHAIRENEIDAGVWNYDEIVEKGFTDLNYVDIPVKDYHKSISEAVIVCSHERLMIQSLFKKNISIEQMHDIQHKVKTGQIVPRF
ncbi:GntR family transcriptional regulator YhfZ [Alkalibacterium kapii]|uniref:Transcriptional regulator n=1 Tax=Alkalibacterium kapii TaxID=426704 RepID=A0A511AVC0_9LACT|nr:GntR family transcriptional regulator YhfZ [Alkalibacterium kapii]GEK92149.1 transcriptional regulator [Alkalibacterium kapii]